MATSSEESVGLDHSSRYRYDCKFAKAMDYANNEI